MARTVQQGNRRIARNTIWNLAATAGPMPIALWVIPILLRDLGTERFGLLALAWTLIGYFTLFDLGLGRALTQYVAQCGARTHACRVDTRVDARRSDLPIPSAFWTAEALMAMLGAAGGAILLALSPALQHFLHLPKFLQAELQPSLYLVAAAIPLITITAGLRGFLEAHQRFGILAPIRAATGALLLLGPVAVLPYAKTLPAMLTAIVTIRAISAAAHAAACIHVAPELWKERSLTWNLAAPLAKFGGWLTVTNVISPLMVSMDRFLIGAQMQVSEVAYYATPYEIATKFLILPAALVGVLFPAFSATLSEAGSEDAAGLYRKAMQALLAVLLPITLLTMILAKPALTLWVGQEMAQRGYRVLQILALGVLINGMAHIPSTLIQSAGRPDLTAKFHLIEFPVYIAALWGAVHWWGIEGAAMAWAGRVAVDAGLLVWVAQGLSGSEDRYRERVLRPAES